MRKTTSTRILDKNKKLADCAAKGKKLSAKQRELLKKNPRAVRGSKFV